MVIMRKTIKKSTHQTETNGTLHLEKNSGLNFRKFLIYEWNDISRNLRTQKQEQPREMCPNFRKFQALPGMVERFPL